MFVVCARARFEMCAFCVYIWLSSSHVVTQHLLNSNDVWYMNAMFNKAHNTHIHYHPRPLHNAANNKTSIPNKGEEKIRNCNNAWTNLKWDQAVCVYIYGVRVLFVTNPTRLTKRQLKIYTRDFLSIALNGIICCLKIGFQRSTERKPRPHTHNSSE